MSVSTAALILLWLIVVVLVFAMAGLRQQLRQITYGAAPRSAGTDTPVVDTTRSAIPEGKIAQALLLVSDGCPVCHEVAPLFVDAATSAPDIDFVVLTRGEGGAPAALGAARHSMDPRLFNAVDPGWQPALVHAGPAGDVLAVRPVGSPQAMTAEVSKLVSAYSQS